MSATTHLSRLDVTPPPPGEPGIVITRAPTALPRDLIVHGTFYLSMTDLEELGTTPSPALALLVTNHTLFAVYTPFADFVVFGDDLHATQGGAVGYFNIDVFELQGGVRGGDYHLSVSLGRHVSNVLHVTI